VLDAVLAVSKQSRAIQPHSDFIHQQHIKQQAEGSLAIACISLMGSVEGLNDLVDSKSPCLCLHVYRLSLVEHVLTITCMTF
jgi:hypothetical protein